MPLLSKPELLLSSDPAAALAAAAFASDVPSVVPSGPSEESLPGDSETRFGAWLAFSALGILLGVTLASLVCAWRQRCLRRRKDRERWGLLLERYAQQQLQQPPPPAVGGRGSGLAAAAEPLLPPPFLADRKVDAEIHPSSPFGMTDGLFAWLAGEQEPPPSELTLAYDRPPFDAEPLPPPLGASPRKPRAEIRHEVAAVAERKRVALSGAWWSVIATWLITAFAIALHALLAGRLGWLDLEKIPAESPATDDVGLLLVWAMAAPLGAGGAGYAGGAPLAGVSAPSAILAIPLPSPSLEDVWKLDLGARVGAYALALCAATPLASLLLLLLVLPWSPPDFEPRTWVRFRGWVLATVETVGIWSLLPVCVLLLLAATAQTHLVLPSIPLPGQLDGGSALRIELSLGCSVVLYSSTALLTLLAANQAALASLPPPASRAEAAGRAAGRSAKVAADSTAAGSADSTAADASAGGGASAQSESSASRQREALQRETSDGSLMPSPKAGAIARAFIAAARAFGATATRSRRWATAGLHTLALLLVLSALRVPVLELDELLVSVDDTSVHAGAPHEGAPHEVALTTGQRSLSLVDIAVGAIGTPLAPATPIVLHGGLSSAAELCGLMQPPAQVVAPLLLLLLVGAPAWRAIAAASLEGHTSGAWRLADVVAAALLVHVVLLSALGPRLMHSNLGRTLHTFARVERVECGVAWGGGAWMLLASAACDAAGRLLGWCWMRRSTQSASK